EFEIRRNPHCLRPRRLSGLFSPRSDLHAEDLCFANEIGPSTALRIEAVITDELQKCARPRSLRLLERFLHPTLLDEHVDQNVVINMAVTAEEPCEHFLDLYV